MKYRKINSYCYFCLVSFLLLQTDYSTEAKIGKNEEVVLEVDRVQVVEDANSEFSQEDVYWLAKIINAEARGESYKGQVAVGAVILNRVKDSKFPDTVYEVIFEKWDNRYYQFSPVSDCSINLEPNKSALKAAEDAIIGEDPTNGALYFYNPQKSTSRWIFSRDTIKIIGKHVFAI